MRLRRKPILAILAGALLVLGLAGVVWAAATTANTTTLTEAQRKELVALQKQILAIRKQIVDKQVEFKLLTPAEGKARAADLDVMAERLDNWDGTWPGLGIGPRMGFGRGAGRAAWRGGFSGRVNWTCPNCGYAPNAQKQ